MFHVAYLGSRCKASVFISALAFACALPSAASAQTFTLVSVNSGGERGNAGSANPSLSADGRFVAFASQSTNLVAGDTNNSWDVFVRDRQANTTTRVSVTTVGQERTGKSDQPRISADGRYVVFVSEAALVPEDTHSPCDLTHPCSDIYVHDRLTSTTTRVSVSSAGGQADGDSYDPSISNDGRFVVFTSNAANLVVNDTNGQRDGFLHDRVSGVTTRISVTPQGQQQLQIGTSARISADGTTIVYTGTVPTSDHPAPASCMGAATCGVTYFLNRETGERGELTTAFATPIDFGRPTLSVANNLTALSGDGRIAVIDVAYDNQGTSINDFLRTVLVDRTTRRATEIDRSFLLTQVVQVRAVSDDGRVVATAAVNGVNPMFTLIDRVNGVEEAVANPVFPAGHAVPEIALDASGGAVAFLSHGNLDGSGLGGGIWIYDRDKDDDLMIDAWETLFGFDDNSAGDAVVDSDGDGASNLLEFQRGTHPKATPATTRYFAEGAANAFFSTRIATLNPNDTPAAVVYRFLGTSGETSSITRLLGPKSRMTLDLTQFDGAPENDFSTVIESDQPIVADRTMTWDASGNGSHAETSIPAPSTTWHMAEGATHGMFDLFYLIQNPGDTAANVRVTYMRLAPNTPIVKFYDVEPHSRKTIWVDTEAPELEAADVAASFLSTQPVIVERAMYASAPGQPFRAGHGGAGVTALATKWYLAEGATGFFDEYVLIGNPGTSEANVRLTFLLTTGETFSVDRTVGPQNRLTLTVADLDPRLANTSLSIIVESTNMEPVVVERAMWYPRGQWYEAHLVAGATETGTRWALADGQSGPEAGDPTRTVDTFILIANTSNTAGTATITMFTEDGRHLVTEATLPANSRVTIPSAFLFAPTESVRFGAIVESSGVPIVVERAMYTTANGITWTAGTASLGTRLP